MKLYVVILLISLISCKKERVCQCTNSYGTYDAGAINASKRQAKKYCQSLSVAQTTCQLKN